MTKKTPEDAAQKAREALDKMRAEQNRPTVEITFTPAAEGRGGGAHLGESTTNPDTPWGGVTDPTPEEAMESASASPPAVTVEWCCREHAILDLARLAEAHGYLLGSGVIKQDDETADAFRRVLRGLRAGLGVPGPAPKQSDVGTFLNKIFGGN